MESEQNFVSWLTWWTQKNFVSDSKDQGLENFLGESRILGSKQLGISMRTVTSRMEIQGTVENSFSGKKENSDAQKEKDQKDQCVG